MGPWFVWVIVTLFPLGDEDVYRTTILLSLISLEGVRYVLVDPDYVPKGGIDWIVGAYVMSLALFVLTKMTRWKKDDSAQDGP